MGPFGFGDGDGHITAERDELERLIGALPGCPRNLDLNRLTFFLEQHLVGPSEDMPPDYRRILELNDRRGERGEPLNGPLGFAKWQGHWFLLAAGQGPYIVSYTCTEPELQQILAEVNRAGG